MNPHHQSASLYIGDLDISVTEAQLFEIFKAVGPVASIRVCRDAITRSSLGYAYVNFHNVADAERALDTLNYTPIKGRPCRIMWCHRDPSVRKSGKGNIFIKNLHPEIDNKALYDTFSTFGNILSCKVVTGEGGVSKGYGFVHYETNEAADEAIAKVNGMSLYDKIVYVGPFIPRKERLEKFTNVYVKHFPADISDEGLRDVFKEFGDIQNAAVSRNAEGESKGFGFVNFVSHEAASKAVEEMNGKKLDPANEEAKPLYVSRAQKKSEREAQLKSARQERANKYQGLNLYVKNLDETVSDEKLREVFANYGDITSAKVMRDDKENSRGFGFVCFASPEDASKAVTEMNGTLIQNKPIYVALAETKEVRKAKLDAQRAAIMAGRIPNGPVFPGAHVFYPPGAGGRGGFVYPPGGVPRGGLAPPGGPTRWAGAPGGPGFRGIPPGYIVNPATRGGRPGGRGRGGPAGGRGRGGPVPRGYKGFPPAVDAARADRLALTTALAAAPHDEERKLIIGEHLFLQVQQEQPALAGKITGMLLESMQVGELLLMLDSPDVLEDKIKEALQVLNRAAADAEGGNAADEAAPAEAAEAEGDVDVVS